MVRTIFWFIYFWGFLLYSTIGLKKAKALHSSEGHNINKTDRLIHSLPREWARSLIKITGSKVTVHNEQNIPVDGPVLFVANHQGNFDIPVLIGHIDKPKGFISKIEVKKLPIVRDWMEVMQCIFIDRNNRRQSVKALQDGVEKLKTGHSMVIFPEGTRSKGNKMGEFKTGSFRLAVKAEVPIVPITINGTYKIMEANGWIMKPAEVSVTVGECIPYTEYHHLNYEQLATLVKTKIEEKL
ncbi:1-acyl-sn-glycerol-3-phosphate acyltransferase [Bacillus sp. HMF5848]|uniref:lysophospholipid acyltransferase family protein n=1 Tax=Bacillus sp. HMF5848 TaxID=2495421 RepID=UPI000F7AF14E|nr:lysophospholipid acyltransferase family protein [Bacillus sp. HMF5848]RSK27242.1 1-acyl-sn-glycerol-3-phosphate acyltransferase [Bacillus sp. HMF5848]